MTVLYLSVQFDHANFGQFSDLRFNLEIFVFSAVIFASSISSEKPIESLKRTKHGYSVQLASAHTNPISFPEAAILLVSTKDMDLVAMFCTLRIYCHGPWRKELPLPAPLDKGNAGSGNEIDTNLFI